MDAGLPQPGASFSDHRSRDRGPLFVDIGSIGSYHPQYDYDGDDLGWRSSLYIPLRLNRMEVRVMVDMGASHLFVSEAATQKLDLQISSSEDCIKMVNAEILRKLRKDPT